MPPKVPTKTKREHIEMMLSRSGFYLEPQGDDIKIWPRHGDPEEMSLVITKIAELTPDSIMATPIPADAVPDVARARATAQRHLVGHGKWRTMKQRQFFGTHLNRWVVEWSRQHLG